MSYHESKYTPQQSAHLSDAENELLEEGDVRKFDCEYDEPPERAKSDQNFVFDTQFFEVFERIATRSSIYKYDHIGVQNT